MVLRKGKTKQLLASGIDCALLAVEIYNRPRALFRVETFITHMIIAWTRVCHARFNHSIGDKFYYKEKQRYRRIDGERKAWELKTCISQLDLNDSVRVNVEFFIQLRNQIEHRFIAKDEIGLKIFGECQSLLNNFEEFVINCFGNEYALNETLAFSLQFSRLRTDNQKQASNKLLSSEVAELNKFIDNFRSNLNDEVFNSQEYSIKLISIPKISNTNRNDLAIEFVNWNNLSEKDRMDYDKVHAIIKDKTVIKEGINPGKLKAGKIIAAVKNISPKFSQYDHTCLYKIYSIRPVGDEKKNDPYNTNTNYCHYDEAHDDYVFQESWKDLIINGIKNGSLIREQWKDYYKNEKKLNVSEIE